MGQAGTQAAFMHTKDRIKLLQELTSELAQMMTIAEVANLIAGKVIPVVGGHLGSIAIVTADRTHVEILGGKDLPQEVLNQYGRVSVDAAMPMTDAVRTSEPIWIETLAEYVTRYPQLETLTKQYTHTKALVALPLISNAQVIGVLTIGFPRKRHFDAEEREFLYALARQCAPALERAQLYANEKQARTEAQAARDRLQFLAEASALLSSSLDYHDTLERVARLAVATIADWCVIDILDEDGTLERLAVAHINPEKQTLAEQLRIRYPLMQPGQTHTALKVLRANESWFDPDPNPDRLIAEARDADHYRLLMALGFKSEIVVALNARDKLLGTITLVVGDSVRRYNASDLALAEELARRAAVAVDNSRLYRLAEQARAEAVAAAARTARLQEITTAFSQALTSAQIAEAVVRQGVAAVGAHRGILLLLNENEAILRMAAHYNLDPEGIERGMAMRLDSPSVAADVVRSGEPIWIENRTQAAARYPMRMDYIEKTSIHAYTGLPLKVEKKILGTLQLMFDAPRRFDTDEQMFLVAVAGQCAIALERARLSEKAKALAVLEERQRLARELHDAVNQTLFSINLLAQSLPRLHARQSDKVAPKLHELSQQTQSAMAEMRTLLLELRPANLLKTSMNELLNQLVATVRGRRKIPISCIVDADLNLPDDVHVALYRIAQESLNNIIKHSEATHASISVRREDEQIELRVKDNGQGFDPGTTSAGLGLNNIRERADAIGAALTITSSVDEGTELLLRWGKKDG
jgi:signal transduction histidine kinase